MKYTSSYQRVGLRALGLATALFAFSALLQSSAIAQSTKLKQSGTVTVNQAQVAFIFSGNVGGGKLQYKGKTYPFSIGGLGVGGIGITSIDASGEVYNLKKLSDFEGGYGEARTGLTLGTNVMKSGLWLQNPKGVYIRLQAKRKGVALSLGLDLIYISMD